MTHNQLLIAANTVWVVVAAVLVMFMQAGFAFLEAGLTRMKNAAHIAGKNVLIFGVASLILRHLSQFSGSPKPVEKSASRKKAALNEARAAQLPPARIEPVSSVTEHTTRTFDPAYRKPMERSQ